MSSAKERNSRTGLSSKCRMQQNVPPMGHRPKPIVLRSKTKEMHCLKRVIISRPQLCTLKPSRPIPPMPRFTAFLNLVKLNKALADAEMTIQFNSAWEKGYFRKGCVLEAMERYDEAVAAFREALQQNPQSTEVATKIKRLSLLARDKKRAQEKQIFRSNVNMAKTLEHLKPELVEKFSSHESGEEIFFFITDIMEAAIKNWHGNVAVDARVSFLFDKARGCSDGVATIVNVDKAFESPDTLTSCVSFLRQHVVDSSSKAACLVVPKKIISFPQVWKGQGTRKWKHGQGDGFFVQFESSVLRKLWFVPSSIEKGQTFCRDPEALDLDAHAVLPPLFR